MLPTPFTDHLTTVDYEKVYEPAEDSFLLLDAVENDLPYLEELKPRICLEIGSGSGIVITALSKKFKDAYCLATDINRHACQVTKKTALRNNAIVESINCNLVDALRPGSVDLLLFNPPYVVTTDEELQNRAFDKCTEIPTGTQNSIVSSWAGGILGRRVIDDLLTKLDLILSPVGVFYLLVLHENKPDELMRNLEKSRFTARKYMERRIPGERLYIIKVIRQTTAACS